MTNDAASSEVTIRPCTTQDVDTLLTLSAQTFKDTFEAYNTAEDMNLYMAKNFTYEQVQRELNDEASTFMLALHEGTAVGYVKLRVNNEPVELQGIKALEIERLYASKAYIGKQVGRKLMHACIMHAQQHRFSVVWLGVWEHNIRAITFYEKQGFKKFSTHVFMLGTDAQTDWLMKLEINNGTLASL